MLTKNNTCFLVALVVYLIRSFLSYEIVELLSKCLTSFIVPPKVITAPRSLIILAKGETARCTCAASGVPHPKVSWYSKGRKILSLPEKISVTSVAGHGQLTILNVGEKDSGDYICQISNNRVRKIVAPSCTVKVRGDLFCIKIKFV